MGSNNIINCSDKYLCGGLKIAKKLLAIWDAVVVGGLNNMIGRYLASTNIQLQTK